MDFSIYDEIYTLYKSQVFFFLCRFVANWHNTNLKESKRIVADQ